MVAPIPPVPLSGPAVLQGVAPGGQPGVLPVASQAAVLVIAVLLVLSLLALIPLVIQLRRLIRVATALVAELREHTAPVADRTRRIAENVDYIALSVRSDVERLHEALTGAARSLDRAARGLEARIREFTALLEVAQEEAEELLVETAAALRGARAGARALGRGRSRPGRARGPEPLSGDSGDDPGAES